MTFTLLDTGFHVLPMRARFPFKYGIACMTALPHLFVSVDMEVDGRKVRGLASDGLPPKWFTKDPTTLFEQDLAEMLAVIQNASRIAKNAASRPAGFFAWWRDVYDEQKRWADLKGVPPLLANLGVSLIERAVLDGLCKAAHQPLHLLLCSPALGIDLAAVHGELRGLSPADVLAPQPLASVAARHTVGLGDPLRTRDIPPAEQLNDGLPYALDESIRAYGLTYFKIKVCGKPEIDLPRLREITAVITESCPGGFHATLDGNEQFEDLAAFRAFYDILRAEPALAPLFQNLLLIEQPLHRKNALQDDVAPAIASWNDGPGLIIDEADGALGDLPRALDLGYSGASHKNCKGIVKGLANAALLKVRAPGMRRPSILSGEDLANVGPIALLQDLAMMAALGVSHVERNGHHYFRGLSMFPSTVQDQVLQAHPDLYRRHEAGFATLNIHNGRLDLQTVNTAPFGSAVPLDVTQFTDLKSWIHSGGMSVL
ncbi:MAG: hypothetical protein U0984_02540 [Prosthecobacter sp.]|nr:hypothetical protein [Prosthecobacter sp.]